MEDEYITTIPESSSVEEQGEETTAFQSEEQTEALIMSDDTAQFIIDRLEYLKGIYILLAFILVYLVFRGVYRFFSSLLNEV